MTTRKFLVLGLWVAAGLGFCGCATDKALLPDLPSQEFTGNYTEGVGQQWFRPSGVPAETPAWWVTFTGQAVTQAEQARAAGRLLVGQPYFVRWRAALTTGGEIGPQGKGASALLVREILELKPAEAGR